MAILAILRRMDKTAKAGLAWSHEDVVQAFADGMKEHLEKSLANGGPMAKRYYWVQVALPALDAQLKTRTNMAYPFAEYEDSAIGPKMKTRSVKRIDLKQCEPGKDLSNVTLAVTKIKAVTADKIKDKAKAQK